MYPPPYGCPPPAAPYGCPPPAVPYGCPPPAMPYGCPPPPMGGYMPYTPGMMIPPGYKLSKKGYLKPISKNPYKVAKKMYKH